MELAVLYVSESELFLADKDYNSNWIDTDKDKLYNLLHSLGLDVKRDLEFQGITQHRNRLNKVVTCGRWLGFERTDKQWINSGYASRAAKIAGSGCKLLGSELEKAVRDFQNDKYKADILTEVPIDDEVLK